jgi:DNA transposition AAA+ family ATPase
MQNSEKQKIVEKLGEYVGRFDSQNKAAKSLKDVSSSTISQMLNEKWDLIKDEMFRHVGAQVGYSSAKWVTVETRDFKMVNHLLNDAQTNSLALGITGAAGSGKDISIKAYAAQNKNVFLLDCNEYWNRKLFLSEMLTVMGLDSSGMTVGGMMEEVVKRIKTKSDPLIILNEADKLSDQVLYFFITLYNRLEDHCGIVLIATDHLSKRMTRGLRLGKKGYNEIYSRIGRKFIELQGVSATDVHQICFANGVSGKTHIQSVWDDCDADLRRVKRKIHAIKKQLNGD